MELPSIALVILIPFAALSAAEADFVAAVTSSHPLAFYRSNATTGKSEVGNTTYSANGGVSTGPGLFGGASQSAKLDGHDGYIVTTQSGGISGTASIMAWVNLDSLPSDEHHFFYVAGESQNGNDFDVQFENDNALRFFTAAGGHLSYTPPAATLTHRWHMIVATLDTPTQTRVMYWDGRSVANDKGGGSPNKSGIFSIGDSTVFRGRYLKGQVEEVALWNRALRASDVAAIYAAANSAAVSTSAVSSSASSAAQFPSAAKVELTGDNSRIPLKPDERIAFLFMSSIQLMESDCQDRAQRACTLDQLVAGVAASDGSRLGHLKFDPRTDPNYTYTLAATGTAWEAHATPKRPGLMGFYFWSRSFPTTNVYYNPAGAASIIDKQFTSTSVEGEAFNTR